MSSVQSPELEAVQGLRVLLVEDDGAFVHFLRESLEAITAELELRVTTRLTSALSLIDAQPFDAILLDLNLPDSAGLETLRHVAYAAPYMPIVVMTGIDDGQQAQAAMRLGAQDWLTKGQPEPGTVLRALRYSVERKRLANDLMRSQQLEAVGRLAGNVAHEFNNVLMTIIGNSERAAVTEDRDVRDQAIRQIQQAATHGALLTRQLLGMSRPRTISAVASADVNQAITNVMGLCQAVLPRSIRIRVTKTDVVRVGLPQEQLEQVLLNLLLNARDAMPEGGVVSVTVAPMLSDRQEAALKRHSTGSDRYGVRVDVSDTGTGIHPDAMRHLFEPFFTTKGTVGTGLGLAISKELVEQAGGTIRVVSAVGEGTSVILDLPAVPTRVEGR